eukprot:6003317-Lingulodinium_polyedra.AAC.1
MSQITTKAERGSRGRPKCCPRSPGPKDPLLGRRILWSLQPGCDLVVLGRMSDCSFVHLVEIR